MPLRARAARRLATRHPSRKPTRRRARLCSPVSRIFARARPILAIAALKYAAAGGETLAQWKLATIYATGDGVPHDDLKAYDYFSQIISGYDEDDPDWRDKSVVSNAFVAIGTYSLNGIADTKVRPDPERARLMFNYAATTFGDATAQYNLARLYLDGVRRRQGQPARLALALPRGGQGQCPGGGPYRRDDVSGAGGPAAAARARPDVDHARPRGRERLRRKISGSRISTKSRWPPRRTANGKRR